MGDMTDEIKRCFGIEKWVWMTKVQTLEQVKNCVRHATNYPNPDAYLNCIGLKKAWYKGKADVFRASGDNLLMCLMAFRTLHGKLLSKREENKPSYSDARTNLKIKYVFMI